MPIEGTAEQTREFLSGMISGGLAIFAIGAALGKYIWSILSKAKDEQIELLKGRIEELRQALEDERRVNDLAQQRLLHRIATLEAVAMLVAPQSVRPEVRRQIEEGKRDDE